ncbi:MAG: ATP-dependent DNA helicase RecG [Chitinispirillaceae bacterium]|nr:ATP-dependent DNA helicase RecG [Chitinispirillaceae bacterium]
MAQPARQEIDFLTPVSACQGIGPKRADALRESGIETVGDLLYHLPRRYIDRSVVVPLSSVESHLNAVCTVAGTVKRAHYERGRRARFRALVSDETGSIELLWFAGHQFVRASVTPGVTLLVTGRVSLYRHFQMVHPLVEKIAPGTENRPAACLPVYSLSEAMRDAGISSRLLAHAVSWALDNCDHFPRLLPEAVEQKRAFSSLDRCLRELHLPGPGTDLEPYRARLRYEELYTIAIMLRLSRRAFALPGRSLHPGDLADRFRATLPFTLTADQEKAIEMLHADAASERRMHRLLQGDVGSGKTLCAFFACFPALASGLQVVWLAPTDVLAMQTFRLVSAWLEPLGFSAALLRGAMPLERKRAVTDGLAAGTLRVVVGTHALLQPAVRFKGIGMIVIDEQHKFGARQRLVLQEKDPASDFLVMSATPIPQTLAKTLYGDLDIVTIERPPEGRRPVATRLVPEQKREAMEHFVRKQIGERGAAAYWVVPRIEQDDEAGSVSDAQTTFARLTAGSFKGVPSACLHGRMSNEDKERVMRSFARGEVRLLVSTTVIEVGVDVPHATCMIIESAERFGLAQLHQLRGRVGRGSGPSWCFILVTVPEDRVLASRLAYFCTHTDGFAIAEKDLELRGPGDVAGFDQTGAGDLRIADILRDAGLWREIQEHLDTLPGR